MGGCPNPRAFRSVTLSTLPLRPISSCTLSSALGTHQLIGRCLPAGVPRLYTRLRVGSWQQGLGVFPVHPGNRVLPNLGPDPSVKAKATACCSWETDVRKAGRPGMRLRSFRERAVGGVPPTYPHSYISDLGSWKWLWLGCALAAMGEAGAGTVLDSLPPSL